MITVMADFRTEVTSALFLTSIAQRSAVIELKGMVRGEPLLGEIAHWISGGIPMSLLANGARFYGHLLLFTILTCLNLPIQAVEQVSTGEDTVWNQLVAARQGSRVRVALRDGSEVTGRLVVVRTDAVVLDEIQTGPSGIRIPPGASLRNGLTFDRADIASIQVLSRTRAIAPRVASSFEQLSVLVAPGQKVSVTDTSGTQFFGTIASLSSSSLSVKVGDRVRDLREGDVATIRQRRSDSLANGALWGLGIGAGLGMMLGSEGDLVVLNAVGTGILGVGIGVGFDALHRDNLVIYQQRSTSTRRVTIAPQLAKSHQSIMVSVKF